MRSTHYSNTSPDGKNAITMDPQDKAQRVRELHTLGRGYVKVLSMDNFLPELKARLTLGSFQFQHCGLMAVF